MGRGNGKMKHYKNDPDLNAEINAIVAAELATLRAENVRLREALRGMLENVISNQAERGQIAVMNARAAIYAKEALK